LNFRVETCDPTHVLLSIIERFTSIGEAEAAVTALEAGGIEVTLFDDVIVALDWMYSNAVAGIKVMVREEDYDAAADILDLPAEEIQEPDGDVEPAEPPAAELPHCPACGLATIATLPTLRVFVCLAVLAGAVGMVVEQLDLAALSVAVVSLAVAATPRHRCTTCGQAFTWRKSIDESPLPQDLIDDHCPRCGSTEIHRLYHRRLKALTMFQFFTVLAVPLSLFPKRVCDSCGLKSY